MYIKKVANFIKSAGLIKNTRSDSQEDTYSCDYINGTLLYENSDGTNSSFSINEDVSNFTKIEIEYCITGKLFHKKDVFPVINNIINQAPLNLNYFSSSNTIQIYTCNLTINNKSCTFNRAGTYNQGTGQTTTTNNLLITKIIGYK